MTVDWSVMKGLIDSKGPCHQWLDLGNKYWIQFLDGAFKVECVIEKRTPTPDPSEQKEFEDSYKANGNKAVVAKAQMKLGEDAFGFHGVGMQFTATAATTTKHYLQLDGFSDAVKGGQAWFDSNSSYKDKIRVFLEDKDNILGYGAGFELGNYVKYWYVIPGSTLVVDDISVAMMPAPGLYLCVEYHSHAGATNNVEGILNLITYDIS